MRAAVLHIQECASWAEAGERLRAALDTLDRHDVAVGYVLVESREEAERYGFAGSPTLLVDGTDLFPEGAATAELACRIYRTPTGFAGVPNSQQILDALALITGVGGEKPESPS